MKVEEKSKAAPKSKAQKEIMMVDLDGNKSAEEVPIGNEEFDDDDFLEKATKKQLEELKQKKEPREDGDRDVGDASVDKEDKKSAGKDEGDGEKADVEPSGGGDDVDAEEEEKMETGDGDEADESAKDKAKDDAAVPTFEATSEEEFEGEGELEEDSAEKTKNVLNGRESKDTTEKAVDNHEDSANESDNKEEDAEDFPEERIVGKHIRHRCSLGKHGLYKWYSGKVIHKATPAEILKLNEESFAHLNNLHTIYTIEYDEYEELMHSALEPDWDKGNLKVVS